MPNATPGAVVAFADAASPGGLATPGLWRRAVRFVRGDPVGIAAVAFLAILALLALLAPLLAPYDPARQLDIAALKNQPPSWRFLFGTDPASRDVLSRVLHGTRVSLSVAVVAVVIASSFGTLYGAVAGFAGGLTDSILMRVVDAFLAVPRILLLLVVVAFWNTLSVPALIVVLGLSGWFGVSRLVRAEVQAVKQRDFVAAARALGASPRRALVRHVVPQVLAPVLVAAAVAVGHLVVVEAGLSFLGHGIPQPRASWGSIIADGREVLASAWWVSFFPGLALATTVLAVNVVADRLRRALDPRQLHA